MSRAHVYIRGKVQGVFFRASTKDQASMLGLKGWVKNCLDGDVEAVFEGEKAAVDNIVNWCKKGQAAHLLQIRMFSGKNTPVSSLNSR
jgi:acylphosphatase